ncbi:MAG TPA: LamG-like jellyroll fold domain-containing protein [Candidatus Acidoferrum sp.]|nr:LamG-like jellyroll fold domain-containing protein [Candidatus Acidoferrum sp.]
MKTQKTLFGILILTAAVALQVHALTVPTNGLVLWNTLGSDSAISNSVYGPNLYVYKGGGFPDVAANQAFVPGVIGTALTIGPGNYSIEDRVHNVVFNNLNQYLNPNSGTVDVWYKQNVDPVPFQNGAIRLFDGSYGLGSGMGLESLQNGLTLDLTFGGTITSISDNISALDGTWINVAGVWNVAGIDGSADKLRLYVNGKVVASTSSATWGGTVGAMADIGGGQDADCAGQFDLEELLVYNRALASNEVAQLYAAGSAPTPPTISCPAPLTLECTNGSATGTIDAKVQDTSGNALEVVWTLDGIPSQTNDIPAGGSITATSVTFTTSFGSGDHVVVVSASDGQTTPATCSTTVTVQDTIPPEILQIVATPNALWPPNHRMIPVNLIVDAVDNCDPSPVSKIIQVTSNEPENRFEPDWVITGPLSVNLRAERLGMGRGRVYTIQVQCEDSSGNISYNSVNVVVPHDKR